MTSQRTQPSTTANQRAAPPGDRKGLSVVDLYNSKISRKVRLQERAIETFSNIKYRQSNGG